MIVPLPVILTSEQMDLLMHEETKTVLSDNHSNIKDEIQMEKILQQEQIIEDQMVYIINLQEENYQMSNKLKVLYVLAIIEACVIIATCAYFVWWK